MDSDKLVEWLVVEKQMGTCSAKDILSRCGRVYRMLGVDTLDENSLELLQQNEQFKASSMFVKSQLKRTVTLCLEFMKKEKE